MRPLVVVQRALALRIGGRQRPLDAGIVDHREAAGFNGLLSHRLQRRPFRGAAHLELVELPQAAALLHGVGERLLHRLIKQRLGVLDHPQITKLKH